MATLPSAEVILNTYPRLKDLGQTDPEFIIRLHDIAVESCDYFGTNCMREEIEILVEAILRERSLQDRE